MELAYILLLVLAVLLSWAIAAEVFREILAKAFKGFVVPTDRPAGSGATLDYAPPENRSAWMRRHLWLPAAVSVLMVVLIWVPVALPAWLLRDRLPDLPLPRTWLFVIASLAAAMFGALLIVRRGRHRDIDQVPVAARWRRSRLLLAIVGCVLAMFGTVAIAEAFLYPALDAQRQEGRAKLVAMSTKGQDAAAAQFYVDAEAISNSDPKATAWLDARDASPEPPAFPSELGSAVAAISKAAKTDDVDFGVDWSKQLIGSVLPHQSRLRRAAMIVRWHAIDRARAGDWDAAVADIGVLHRISRQCGRGVTLIEWMTGLGVDALAMDTAGELLSFASDESQVEKLSLPDPAWYAESAHRALSGEEAVARVMFADILQGRLAAGAGRWNSSGVRFLVGPAELHDIDVVFSAGHAAANHIDDEILPQQAVLTPKLRTRSLMASILASSTQRAAQSAIPRKSMRQNLELAIAATKYRLRTGELPKDPQALAGAGLIDRIPLDPWDGKPWRLVHKGDHVIIYSIGEDRIDHGGADGYTSRKARDDIMRVSAKPLWVFEPQPEPMDAGVTPAEQ